MGTPLHWMGTPEERFIKRCPPPDENGCINWQGARSSNPSKNWPGYGTLSSARRTITAHRYAWERVHGPIPDGLKVLHSCDNPGCVNVEHLSLGTQADNLRDMTAKGRRASGRRVTHCPQGHEYNDENARTDTRGFRHCRICSRAACIRSRARKQVAS